MAKSFEPFQPNKAVLASLAKQIKGLRRKRGLTIEDFAEKSGLYSTYLQTIERNHRNISISVFISIAKALEIPAPKLLSRVLKDI